MIYNEKEFTLKDGLKVTLKTPKPEEAEAVISFMTKLFAQTDYFLSSPEDYEGKVEGEKRFLEGFKDNDDYFIAAYADGEIIGDCSLNFCKHHKDKHRCSLGIGVDKTYWGRGLGNLFMDEIIRLAEEKENIEQIELGVADCNERALRLYEKKGFSRTGVIPKAFKQKDGSYFDEVMMTRFL